jgi:hypothetical protein
MILENWAPSTKVSQIIFFAKNGGAAEVSRITKQACVRSPITRTLYLLKHVVGTHIRNTLDNFPLHPTQLEMV